MWAGWSGIIGRIRKKEGDKGNGSCTTNDKRKNLIFWNQKYKKLTISTMVLIFKNKKIQK